MSALSVTEAFRRALYLDGAQARSAVVEVFADGAVVKLAYPFETLDGGAAYWDQALGVLATAWPDFERREHIVMSGVDEHGDTWVGCCGHYIGTFAAPFLDIPPTGRITTMRYHEFFRVEGGKIVEMQALWDIPEVMMQAGAWPMVPSLGRELMVPGPATQDGLGPHVGDADAARDHVLDMLVHLSKHPGEGGPEVMEMDRFWHPKFNWYGPAGIGSMRGVDGFRRDHQIPFLAAMPDRGLKRDEVVFHFFAEGDYVGVTGWPDMKQTITDGGWLGIAPSGQQIEMRSLDFWRLEDGLIRENWVLVDLLSVYDQLGIDVFARMREMTRWSNV